MRVARIHGLTGERVDCAPTVEIAEPDRALGHWPRKLVDAEIDELLAVDGIEKVVQVEI